MIFINVDWGFLSQLMIGFEAFFYVIRKEIVLQRNKDTSKIV